MKECHRCRVFKSLESFSSHVKNWDGLETICRGCKKYLAHLYYLKTGCQKEKGPLKEIKKKRRAELKAIIIDGYGGICVCCKESHPEFLTVDHPNNDGWKERKSKKYEGHKFYTWLKINNFPKDYQLLCWNCNVSLGFLGYCPHKPLEKRKTYWEQRMG